MKREPKTVEITVRENSAIREEGENAFQASIVPNESLSGRQLYERLAEFLGYAARDPYRAEMLVNGIEQFVRRELEQGNRIDFGLVSFYPRLSGALPTRDADPSAEGLSVRGAVKARKSLSASLDEHLLAVNPVSGVPIRIYGIYDKTQKKMDNFSIGNEIQISWRNITLDPTHPDERIWLEKPIKRRRQKHIPVAFATDVYTEDTSFCRCTFRDPLPVGRYMLTVGTRAGEGENYKLRYARHAVRVV